MKLKTCHVIILIILPLIIISVLHFYISIICYIKSPLNSIKYGRNCFLSITFTFSNKSIYLFILSCILKFIYNVSSCFRSTSVFWFRIYIDVKWRFSWTEYCVKSFFWNEFHWIFLTEHDI